MPKTASTPPGGLCKDHGVMLPNQDSFSSTPKDNNDPTKTPEIIDLDPNLATAPQQPIPNFRGMNSPWMSENSRRYLDHLRQGTGKSFGSTLMQGIVNIDTTGEISLSPDAALSDRPTPNSSTSQQNSSSHTAANTSPASSSANISNSVSQQSVRDQLENQYANNVQAMFDSIPGSGLSNGLTSNKQFTTPETPKNINGDNTAATTEEFSWDSFTSGVNGGTAMTPMSESVLKTMLQMGPMETMDMGWDNPQ